MRSTVERELKLGAGAGFAGIPFEGRELPEEVLTSTYFDTDDLRLAEGRIARRPRAAERGEETRAVHRAHRGRSEGREPAWQLKLPTDGDRLELEWPAPTEAVPAEVRDLLKARTRGA